MISVKGVLEFVDIGTGTWKLNAGETTYQLHGFQGDLAQSGETAEIEGEIVSDSMSTGMTGNPVLEVKNSPKLDPLRAL